MMPAKNGTYGKHVGRPMWTTVGGAMTMLDEWVAMGGHPAPLDAPYPGAYNEWVDLIARSTLAGPFFMGGEQSKELCAQGVACVRGEIFYGTVPPMTAAVLKTRVLYDRAHLAKSFSAHFMMKRDQHYLHKLGCYPSRPQKSEETT